MHEVRRACPVPSKVGIYMVGTWHELYRLCRYGHTYSERMDQPGKVANPAHGQLNKEK